MLSSLSSLLFRETIMSEKRPNDSKDLNIFECNEPNQNMLKKKKTKFGVWLVSCIRTPNIQSPTSAFK